MTIKEWEVWYRKNQPKDLSHLHSKNMWRGEGSTFIPMTCTMYGIMEHKNKVYEVMAHSRGQAKWVDITHYRRSCS